MTTTNVRARVTALAGYESLARVLDDALEQAQSGKGNERHANGEPFDQQPIVALNEMLGSTHGCLYQACKKAMESRRLKPGAAIRDLLGAINYLAAAIVMLQHEEAKEQHRPEPAPESDYERRNADLHRLARLAGKL